MFDASGISTEATPPDIAAALARLKGGQRHRVDSDLASAIMMALEQRTQIVWWHLFSYAYLNPVAGTTAPAAPPQEQQQHREHLRAQKTLESTETDEDASLGRRVLTETYAIPFDSSPL